MERQSLTGARRDVNARERERMREDCLVSHFSGNCIDQSFLLERFLEGPAGAQHVRHV